MKYTKPFYVRDENDEIVLKGTRSECISFSRGNGKLKIVKNPRYWRKKRRAKDV